MAFSLAANAIGSAAGSAFGKALGGLFGGAASSAGAFLNYESQKKLMDRQNAFTKYMSDTAHQREVVDLRASGLNPALSALGGSGASTPSAGTGSLSTDFANGVNSALAWRQQKNENDIAETQQDLNTANAFRARKESALIGEQARNEAERYDSIIQDRINSINLTAAQIENYKKQGDAALINAIANQSTSAAQVRNYDANTKYTNERSRGYSESDGFSLQGSGFGVGLGGSRSHSRTY